MQALFVEGAEFLPKPCDLDQLATKVNELTAKRSQGQDHQVPRGDGSDGPTRRGLT